MDEALLCRLSLEPELAAKGAPRENPVGGEVLLERPSAPNGSMCLGMGEPNDSSDGVCKSAWFSAV